MIFRKSGIKHITGFERQKIFNGFEKNQRHFLVYISINTSSVSNRHRHICIIAIKKNETSSIYPTIYCLNLRYSKCQILHQILAFNVYLWRAVSRIEQW